MITENTGKFESLNFIINHESLDFIGYEFEGEEITIEENGCEQSLFRLHVDKESGEAEVFSAYSEDYDIMEEVTFYFDTDKLLADIKKFMDENKVDNHGEAFVKYIQLTDEGYDCSQAVLMVSDYLK